MPKGEKESRSGNSGMLDKMTPGQYAALKEQCRKKEAAKTGTAEDSKEA